MAEATKKTTRSKKSSSTKSAIPTAKAVAAEAKPQSTPAAVIAAVKPTPVAKPAPVSAKSDASITKAERQRRIEQAAYYRAEKHGFQGDSSQHWAAAEAEIDADLKKRNIRVV